MSLNKNREKAVAFAGAGLSSAVIARYIAERRDLHCLLFEERAHTAGNCHTERHRQAGVMVHKYGPHIFHTEKREIWDYVNTFCAMMPFNNRVKAVVGPTVYTLPINLHTINQFYQRSFHPDEARAFIASQADHSIQNPQNFEEQALASVGEELYRAFFYGYTKKQWGVEPREIPATVWSRLPLRFNYDDSYYSHPYQGIPRDGYTDLVNKILDHPKITVVLETRFEPAMAESFAHTFWSGPIDAYFDSCFGPLSYRTLYWKEELYTGDRLGTAVINYPDIGVAHTRVHEHKHFAPWESHERSAVYTEYSKAWCEGDIPYYPMNLKGDKECLALYQKAAEEIKGVTFVGRLGTYRYLDMDMTIYEGLKAAKKWLEKR